MKNEVMPFENRELGFKAHTIVNEDGSISINAEDMAIGYGWYEQKSGKSYPRWRTINGYLKELGFSQEVAKDDYIPKSLFYMLGFKAGNDKALGYKRPADAVSQHCRYTVKHRIPHPQNADKTLEVNVIPEGDLYRLITHSELKTAQ